jgi:hypothetical protein
MKFYNFFILLCSSSAYASQHSLLINKTTAELQQGVQSTLNDLLAAELGSYWHARKRIIGLLATGAQPNNDYITYASEDGGLYKLLKEGASFHVQNNLQLSAALEQAKQLKCSNSSLVQEQDARDKGDLDATLQLRRERVKQEERSDEMVREFMSAGSDRLPLSDNLPPVVTITCHKPEKSI